MFVQIVSALYIHRQKYFLSFAGERLISHRAKKADLEEQS